MYKKYIFYVKNKIFFLNFTNCTVKLKYFFCILLNS